MKRIGILSDTHHCFDVPLRRFFSTSDELWHAGDIGAIGLADEISAFKPLRAVYGNIDGGDVRAVYPRCLRFAVEGVDVLMIHIGGYPGRYAPEVLPLLRSCPPKLFVAGHSHILKVVYDPVFQLLHINPGAAGTYGFHKVRTAVRLVIDGGDIRDLEVLELGIRG
ncbi:MAG: metallophosphatase family protein [Prevotellaceae bacterium]|jgi:putative phosphoesterase|nr:metallophosphatase family protein [Prevotellaceae bacterium]